jgi:hypothetical protein
MFSPFTYMSPGEEILYMGEGVPLAMLSCHCHLWLRSWGRHLCTSSCSHLAGVTLIFLPVHLILPICLATQVAGSPLLAEGL